MSSNSGMRGMVNKYTVTKTIRFELKPVYKEERHPDINFEKTRKWLEKEHFYSIEENEQDKTECKEVSKADKKESRNTELREIATESFEYFEKVKVVFNKLLEKSIPHFAVLVRAALLENLDLRLYHKEKRGFNKSKFIPLTTIRIDNYDWFYEGLEKRLQKITEQKIHITEHSLWKPEPKKTMMNNANWYKDIERFASDLEAFIALYPYIDIQPADELNNCDDECKKQVEKINEQLTPLKNSAAIEKEKHRCSELKELIKEHIFTECGLTSLNSKALNKDPEKRKREQEWLVEKEEELKKTECKINKLDGERKQVLDGCKKTETKGLYELIRVESKKKWNQIKEDDEYALHLLDEAEYNQKLLELKEQVEKLETEREKLKTERDKLKELKDKKLKDKKLGAEIGKKSGEIKKIEDEICKIKDEIVKKRIKKRMTQDRKRIFLEKGVLPSKLDRKKLKREMGLELGEPVNKKNNTDEFVEEIRKIIKDKKKLLNFSYIWNCKEGCQKLECIASDELQKLYKENNELIEKKKKFSQERGQSKMLIHSLKREIERQNKIDHFALLIKNRHFFYLALICREERKEIMKQIQSKEESKYTYLEYERLTMKALEKIVFHEKMASDDPTVKEWSRKYSEYIKNKDKDQKKPNRHEYSKKEEFITLFTKKIRDLKYNFTPKKHYKTTVDFAHDVNTRLYTVNWQSINEDKLFELEKEGKIKIFKIHNKDFSWAKRKTDDKDNSKKNNLFTSYWLDLMDNIEKNVSRIRILPEIDLYKKRKERDMSESQPVKNSVGKKLEGTVKGRRFRENKFYAAFHLEFYPEKETQELKAFNNSLLKKTKHEKTYFLGLDRGEKELITYCLIDEEGKIVKNNTGELIIGDWNKDNKKLKGEPFNYADKIEEFTENRKKLLLENMKYDEDEKLKLEKKVEQDKIREVRSIKEGFCSHVLEQINEIMCQYKNVYIVMEDLDKEQKNNNKSNKEDRLEKTLGASAYQAIEDAIVSKFKYFRTKDKQFMGNQIVPNIERIADLRITKEAEDNRYGKIRIIRSKEQIGNILFVNEYYTSQICPECDFCVCCEGEKAELKTQSIAKPLIIEDMKSNEIINKEPLIIKINGTDDYTIIKHPYWKQYLEKYWENGKIKTIDPEDLKKIFKPRLKNNNMVDKEKLKQPTDPFYCPKCGKNTEDEDKKFSQGFKSGDDIAAYNIARLGLDYYKNQ